MVPCSWFEDCLYRRCFAWNEPSRDGVRPSVAARACCLLPVACCLLSTRRLEGGEWKSDAKRQAGRAGDESESRRERETAGDVPLGEPRWGSDSPLIGWPRRRARPLQRSAVTLYGLYGVQNYMSASLSISSRGSRRRRRRWHAHRVTCRCTVYDIFPFDPTWKETVSYSSAVQSGDGRVVESCHSHICWPNGVRDAAALLVSAPRAARGQSPVTCREEGADCGCRVPLVRREIGNRVASVEGLRHAHAARCQFGRQPLTGNRHRHNQPRTFWNAVTHRTSQGTPSHINDEGGKRHRCAVHCGDRFSVSHWKLLLRRCRASRERGDSCLTWRNSSMRVLQLGLPRIEAALLFC